MTNKHLLKSLIFLNQITGSVYQLYTEQSYNDIGAVVVVIVW